MARTAVAVADNFEAAEAADPRRDKIELEQRLQAIAGKLDREAQRREGLRQEIEKRWLTDIEQYHGKYDEDTRKGLDKKKRSKQFINQTRPKTNATAAKLGDMLFPTDDRNWGIEPTPVPTLATSAADAVKMALTAKEQAQGMPEGSPEQAQAIAVAGQAEDIAGRLQAEMDEAKKRAAAMADEIDDQLREARYQTVCRRVIEDACKIGTGIIKGPVVSDRLRKRWQPQQVQANDNGGMVEQFALSGQEDPRPTFLRVDPWSFFPDPDACSMEESEGEFERHLLNEKQVRALARQPGFDADAIRRVLKAGSRETSLNHFNDLRSITGSGHTDINKRFKVWEYHGCIDGEDFVDIASAMGKGDMLEDMGEIDPLTEINVTLWFCQNEVLKFGIHPMDSGESIYSVFNLEKDEASIFGFGIPYLMRDSQSALNAAWRMMMDNGGITSGPNIVVNKELIEPEDNESYEITPWKTWTRKNGPSNVPAFESYDFNSHQAELAGIIQMARQFMDDETNVSQLAQGEQGTHTTQTAQGMSILMNATNTVFRRIVKNWDDDLTTPTIRRIYDWNMQFSDKEHIKGDYDVDARGSSVLLVREMQSQSLMAIALSFGGHPVFGPGLKPFPLLRRLMQSQMLPANEIVKTDEELAQEAAAAAGAPAPDLEIMKLENEMNIADMEVQSRERIAMIERETALIKMAENGNMEMDKLMALLADKDRERQTRAEIERSKINSKERIFTAEAAMTPAGAPAGGGYL